VHHLAAVSVGGGIAGQRVSPDCHRELHEH
jgi:hypothetical protein